MPTYWKASELTHPADSAVHAGKTRITLQDNLRCVAENSGYDYDVCIRDMPLSESVTDSWAWLSDIDAFPIPVWRNQGNTAWRSYAFEILGESTTALTNITLRVFILKNKSHPTIDATTGDVSVVGGVTTSYKDIVMPPGLARRSDTVNMTDADWASSRGVSVDIAWVHIAGYTAAVGGADLEVYAMNIKESS